MIILLSILIAQLSSNTVLSWDADAGIVPSWTKMAGVSVTATSSVSPPTRVLDNDDNTGWVSSNCLPNSFVSRDQANILKGLCSTGKCSATSTRGDISAVTDGALSSITTFPVVNSQALVTISLRVPATIQLLTVWGRYQGDTQVMAVDDKGNTHQLRTLTTADSYNDITIKGLSYNVTKLTVQSSHEFYLKEVGAIGKDGCTEDITVNLGISREVATIRTRHWAGTGNAQGLSLSVSVDGSTWKTVTSLDPVALHAVVTRLDPPQQVQYIKLRYSVTLEKYRKVFCYEIDAWNSSSKWGIKPPILPQTNTLRQILGVNGIWGWGHNKYSNQLGAAEGPGLYSSVASSARNYHNLDWDVLDPDNDPEFTEMANGGGTNAKSWLNWDTEYTAWKNAGLSIDASIQFTNKSFSQSKWNHPEQSAYNYGKEFAKHFGPDVGNRLVMTMEVGNEPWDYDSSFYRQVLKGMSAGVRSVDKTIYVMPGAFQAHDKHDTGNYIGTKVTQDIAVNISAVNFHTYSYRQSSQGVRTGTYPEHRDSTFNSINNIVRWRDTNMPGKPIWVTEWGWDSPGSGADCTFPECVSERGQALYAVRGLLILARSNAEKVHWFFYANSNYCGHLYCRSGLTTSNLHNFAKKLSFLAFESLLGLLGDNYFIDALQEDEDAYIYAFGHAQNANHPSHSKHQSTELATHLVAWKPVSAEDSSTSVVNIQLPVGSSVMREWTLTGSAQMVKNSHSTTLTNRILSITVSTQPIILQLHHTNFGPAVGK